MFDIHTHLPIYTVLIYMLTALHCLKYHLVSVLQSFSCVSMTTKLCFLERNVLTYKCAEGCVCVDIYIYMYTHTYILIICMFGFDKALDLCFFKVFLCHVFYAKEFEFFFCSMKTEAKIQVCQ